ncbi:MAG: hypothetical protein ACOH2F_10420 [Cellulomonas sp.]
MLALRGAADLARATGRPLLALVPLRGTGVTTDPTVLFTRGRRLERTAQLIAARVARAAGLSPEIRSRLAAPGSVKLVTWESDLPRWLRSVRQRGPVAAGLSAARRAGVLALVVPACLHPDPTATGTRWWLRAGEQFEVVPWRPGTLVYVNRAPGTEPRPVPRGSHARPPAQPGWTSATRLGPPAVHCGISTHKTWRTAPTREVTAIEVRGFAEPRAGI